MMQIQDMITMTTKELKRLHMIRKTIEREITQSEAAESCGLSERQVRRIVSRIKAEGDSAVIHRLRNKSSNAGWPKKQKERIIALYKKHYPDFGPTLAQEKLLEEHKITIGDETLRLWLHKAGLVNYRTRKSKRIRQRRERKECFGQMIQMDGSHHDWLERRGPWLVLMGYIDDATGRVFGEFHDYEGTFPAMASFKAYASKRGLPLSVYVDKHSTYRPTTEPSIEDQLKGREFKAQFQRALEELGVEVIHAHSPQAKGRVERLFGTFQDRLVKELRLRGAKTKEDANRVLREYLPKFNRKFERIPKSSSDLHRPAPSPEKLRHVLSIQHECALANDSTIRLEGKIYLIKDRLTKNRTKKIRTEERMDGKLYLMDGQRQLRYERITEPPRLAAKEKPKRKVVKKAPVSDNHPFKRFVLSPASAIRSAQSGFVYRRVSQPQHKRINPEALQEKEMTLVTNP